VTPVKSVGPERATACPGNRGPGVSASARAELHRELAKKLGSLPKDLGISLIGLGAVGVIIPGPVPLGATFVVLGAVVLWPCLLARTGGPLARTCPSVFRVLVNFTDHLKDDLNHRYPSSRRR
jgi:hypothetical protein